MAPLISTSSPIRFTATSTVFTLPSPPKKKSTSSSQTHQQLSSSTITGDDSYEEQSSSPQSSPRPSLPWLVEYWSSSFLRAPAMIIDQMCACSSNVHNFDDSASLPTTTTQIMMGRNDDGNGMKQNVHLLDDAHRIDINDPHCFDGVVVASRKAPSSLKKKRTKKNSAERKIKNHFHRKSKSLTERWDQLRSVVASHDDSLTYDYYEDVVMSVGAAASADESDARYPSKMYHLTNNHRQSSIVMDTDDEDDADYTDNGFEDDILLNPIVIVDDAAADDDDIRMAPPLSPSPTLEEEDDDNKNNKNSIPFRNKKSYHRNNKKHTKQHHHHRNNSTQYMDITACHSFDQYIDTTQYLCADSESEHVGVAVTTTPPSSLRRAATPSRPVRLRPQLTTTTTTPSSPIGNDDDGHIDRITPLPQQFESPVHVSRIRTPPSPAPSTQSMTDTCTTISLSQSYANEFENEDEEEQEEHHDQELTAVTPGQPVMNAPTTDNTSSSSFDCDLKNGSMFLDRLASEQFTVSSSPPAVPVVTNIMMDDTAPLTIPIPPSTGGVDSNNTITSFPKSKSSKNKKKLGGSPFRRLRPRSSKKKKVTSFSNEEDKTYGDEGIEQTLAGGVNDENLYPTKSTTSMSMKSSYSGISSKSLEDDEEDGTISTNTNTAYRYLIRMNPQNYKLSSTLSETSSRNNEGSPSQALASASSLLPLHPHQRIIAPLPHQDSTFDEDNSGYTYIRDTLRRQHIADVQGIEELRFQQQPPGQPTTSVGYQHQYQPEPQPVFRQL